MDSRSISAAITQGIREALNTNDEASFITQNANSVVPNEQSNNDVPNANVSSSVSFASTTDQFRNRRGRK